MKLILSKNSIHAKYYRWFYYAWSMPDNLCTYFWLLILAFIFIPATIFCLPVIIMSIIKGENVDDDWFERLWYSLLGWVAFIFLLAYIKSWFDYTAKTGMWTGIAIGGGLIIVGFIWLINYLQERKYERMKYEEPKEKTTTFRSMTWQWVKAKKNRYCPKIDWL